MPRTAAWIRPGTTVRQLRDPAHNVDVGFLYLRKLIDRYEGDVEMALLAYNRGPGTVDRIVRRGGNPDNGYPAAVLHGAAKRGG
jgi:soluble lytic murein transglycosylase-like protein